MFKNIRKKIAELIAPEYVQEIEDMSKQMDGIEERVNQRIAKVLLDMDPFEPFMRKYHGVFSEQFEHPEDKLDAKGQLLMKSWGYQQRNDPSFKFMTEWMLNTQGNNTLRKAKIDHEWFFGRACIVSIELFVRETGRLAGLYEELIEKDKNQFDENLTVE